MLAIEKGADKKIEQRDRWGNRAAFILAAIGSAAGLGNAWRFYITVRRAMRSNYDSERKNGVE
ncbi:MAG: hypothetical protein UMV23_03420 [Halanaerobium sp.]|nr:hypothetical protein [Halanaerobium sp.]